MTLVDWLSSAEFDWIAGSLAVSLMVVSFGMIATALALKKRQ